MLARIERVVTLTLALCLFTGLAAQVHAVDLRAKREAAKRADRSGYQPALLRAVATSEVEPNDTPAQAQVVTIMETVDATVPGGDEDWFSISAGAGSYLAVSTAPSGGSTTDTVLEVYAADGTTLLAIDDDHGLGLFSALEHLLVPAEGKVLLRVTRFGPLGDDAYLLAVEEGTPPPPAPANDSLETAEDMANCNTAVTASTVGATDAVHGVGCVDYDPLGGDVFFRVELPYSYQLHVQVEPDATWDPSLYLFTDATDPSGSCIAGADVAYTGELEEVTFTNEDPGQDPRVIFLAVDSWDPAQSGGFTLFASCDFVVPVETGTWGALKSRF